LARHDSRGAKGAGATVPTGKKMKGEKVAIFMFPNGIGPPGPNGGRPGQGGLVRPERAIFPRGGTGKKGGKKRKFPARNFTEILAGGARKRAGHGGRTDGGRGGGGPARREKGGPPDPRNRGTNQRCFWGGPGGHKKGTLFQVPVKIPEGGGGGGGGGAPDFFLRESRGGVLGGGEEREGNFSPRGVRGAGPHGRGGRQTPPRGGDSLFPGSRVRKPGVVGAPWGGRGRP